MTQLYKVLSGGRSCHGGDLQWSLPTPDGQGGWTPGDWHEVAGDIAVCWRGLHLTTTPSVWVLRDAASDCYAAETDDLEPAWLEDKCAVRRARLLRPVPWVEVGVLFLSEGVHEVRAGVAILSGNASVKLYGSASAKLYGSASAELYDNASATSTEWHEASAPVSVIGEAVHIDRRGAVLVVRTACEARLERAVVQ